jgi:hypothetical protein
MEVAVLGMIALKESSTFSQGAVARLKKQSPGSTSGCRRRSSPLVVADCDSSHELDNVEDALW